MRSFSRKRTLPLSALLTAIAVAGCQAYPPVGPGPTAAQTQVRDAHVSADLGPLLARLQTRKVLGQGFDEPAITQYRLSARGPGMAAVTSSPVTAPAPTPDPKAYHTLGTAPVIQLDVSSGVNRVFMLEGLDAQGHVLASIATLATLQSGAALSLTFGADTDAAARVLDRVLQSHQDTFPAVAPFFTADQTAPLLAFINRVIGASGGNFVVNPLAIDREFIVGKLRAEGTSFFGVTNLPTELTKSVWGRLNLVVTSMDGKTPIKVDSAEIAIFDPVSGSAYGMNADPDTSEVTFDGLPQGTWAVRVRVPGFPDKWDTVTVSGTTFARVSPFPAPAGSNYTLSEVEGGASAIATSPDGARSLAVWVVNGEVSRVQGIFLDQNHQPIGDVMYIRDYENLSPQESPYRYTGAGVAYDPVHHDFLVTWIQQTMDYPHEAAGCKVTLNGGTPQFGETMTFVAESVYDPSSVVATYGANGHYAVAQANSYAIAFDEYWEDAVKGPMHDDANVTSCADVADPSLAYNPVTRRYVLAWSDRTQYYEPQRISSDIATYTVGDESMANPSFSRFDANDTFGDFSHPAIAPSDTLHGTQLIVWEDESAGAIRSALFETGIEGTVGAFQEVATGDVYLPRVATVPHGASSAGRYLVGWQDGQVRDNSSYRTLGMFGNPRPVVRFMGEDGTPDITGAFKLSDSDGQAPALTANPATRKFVAVWNTPGYGPSTLFARVMQ